MEVGESPLGIAPLAVGQPTVPQARAYRDHVPTLPFPEKFVGSFNEDGSVRVGTERLAFEVRRVETQDDLFKAVAIRYEAYSRHLPELGRRLTAPESADTEPGYTVLLAENRLDRSPLATVRLQVNEFGPLALERSIDLPGWLQGRKLAEATRLALADNVRGRFVTQVMFKAFFQFCLEHDVEWMVVCARPPLDPHLPVAAVRGRRPWRGLRPAQARRTFPTARLRSTWPPPRPAGERPATRCTPSWASRSIRTSASESPAQMPSQTPPITGIATRRSEPSSRLR